MADPSTRRRWFVFSLRRLLLATTVCGSVLGWLSNSLHWIDQRRWALANGDCAVRTDDVRAPAGLWLLGEPGAYRVFAWVAPPDPQRAKAAADRLERLFPEAVVEIHPFEQESRPPLNTRRGWF